MSDQTVMWDRPKPPRDETPIEAGGAVVSFRLSPREALFLRTLNDTDTIAAIHALIARASGGLQVDQRPSDEAR